MLPGTCVCPARQGICRREMRRLDWRAKTWVGKVRFTALTEARQHAPLARVDSILIDDACTLSLLITFCRPECNTPPCPNATGGLHPN